VNALHVFWTAPYRARGCDVSDVDVLPWFERVFLAASALIWRCHSGEVTLVTDPAGAAAVERWGLVDCWNNIDVETLQRPPTDIDPAVFWDIGKTLALATARLPVALLDLDLIAWRSLKPVRPTHFLHFEEIEPPWYPAREDLARPPGYAFPDVDWSVRPANTALLYLASEPYRDRFVFESLRYAAGNVVPERSALAAFLFSGQRLFSLVGGVDDCGVSPYLPFLFSVHQPSRWLDGRPATVSPLRPNGFRQGEPITHLWSYKHELRRDDDTLETYCAAVLAHIQEHWPTVSDAVLAAADLNAPSAWRARLAVIAAALRSSDRLARPTFQPPDG
jgi:hypothetical protein